jgi:hypothetical protein
MAKQNAPIIKTVFGKNTYPKVIDTEFRELITQQIDTSEFRTVDYFFELYEDLFYEIPQFGEFSSHEYIAQRSTDYIGTETRSSDVDALIEEINDLRRQLVDANQQIIELSSSN